MAVRGLNSQAEHPKLSPSIGPGVSLQAAHPSWLGSAGIRCRLQSGPFTPVALRYFGAAGTCPCCSWRFTCPHGSRVAHAVSPAEFVAFLFSFPPFPKAWICFRFQKFFFFFNGKFPEEKHSCFAREIENTFASLKFSALE